MENDTMSQLFTVSEEEATNDVFTIMSSTNIVVKKV
jgi:hypothetical protein